jgi:photosynthetic reaction center H subunit
MERTAAVGGFPLRPTGDPMADGVGPASWAPREDKPELDGKGYPKIVPMSSHDTFLISAGRDPRGLPVMGRDKEVAGTVTDLWIDEPEQLVRYIEVDVEGAGKRLVPIQLAVIKRGHVMVRSLVKERFAGIPALKSDKQITKLEEDKVSAYVAAGSLYGAGNEAPLEAL